MNLEFLTKQWYYFCHTTGIKAFSFLSNAKTKWEKFLWFLAITVGVVFTVIEVTNTIRTYNTHPTLTKMELKYEHPYSIDPVAVCIWYSKATSENFGLNITNNSEVEYLLKSIPTETHLLNFLNPRSINETDLQLLQFVYFCSMVLQDIMSEELQGISERNAVQIELLRNFLLNRNVSIQTLAKVIAIIQCRLIKFSVFKLRISSNFEKRENLTDTEHLCKNGITWNGGNPFMKHFSHFCLKVPANITYFSQLTSFLSISLESQNLFKMTPLYFTVHFTNDHVVTPDAENFDFVLLNNAVDMNLKPLGHYKLLSTANCSLENSTSNCLISCQANYIRKRFGCSPVFETWIDGNTSNLPNCFDTLKGKFNVGLDANLAVFKQKCSTPCDKFIFSIVQDVPYIYNAGYTQLNIGIDSYSYPYFEETESMSFRQFLSQLGGNLSLWIGASFLVLLHMTVFIAKLPHSYLTQKKEKKEEIQKPKDIVDVKFIQDIVDARIKVLLEAKSKETQTDTTIST